MANIGNVDSHSTPDGFKQLSLSDSKVGIELKEQKLNHYLTVDIFSTWVHCHVP